ncbi:hypothetical protein FZEAL_8484 [Fusarium zealandicum]|uniref:Nephrocystin 3-like N-terminal domain-containing protein n=1 Tax=Fusarium zealandicum TaxID=1053134 RepID=A0A8H4UDN6_9HYPO|nr:hypothetical protein FZEAL_8484 [Fusarium zealandicum]
MPRDTRSGGSRGSTRRFFSKCLVRKRQDDAAPAPIDSNKQPPAATPSTNVAEDCSVSATDGQAQTESLWTLAFEEDEYKDTTPKCTIGDRQVIWRDYADRVVTSVIAIGDVGVAFAPSPSAPIWGAIKVLLKAHVHQLEDLVAIFGCTDKVLSVVRRGGVYEGLYPGGSLPEELAKDLRLGLLDVYRKSLELLAHVKNHLSRGLTSQFLQALVQAGKGEGLVSDLSTSEASLLRRAHVCEAHISRKRHEQHMELLQSLDEPLKRTHTGVEKLLSQLDEAKYDKVMELISPIPFGDHHLKQSERKTPGTCEWLLKKEAFHEWENSSWSAILWLRGNMGAGKSFLASKVVDRYRSDGVQGNPGNEEGFAYFYCDRSSATQTRAEYILQSYVRQLSRVPGHSYKVPSSIYALYQKARNDGGRSFTKKECYEILPELVNTYSRTTLVLDGLDECDLDDIETLMKSMVQLVTESSRLVKVFIASRKVHAIERHLGPLEESQDLIHVETSDNQEDIERFIETEMNEMGSRWQSVSKDVQRKAKNEITSKSKGMFRFAYLQWQDLKGCETNEDVEFRLKQLPSDLTGAYDDIYSRAKGFHKVILQRAVKWVICAREPFTSDMLCAAVRLGVPKDETTEQALEISSTVFQESTLEGICLHFLVRDAQRKAWSFAHASVAEYFENEHQDWVSRAQEEVTTLVIRFLIHYYTPDDTDSGPGTDSETGSGLKLQDFRNHRHSAWHHNHPLRSYAHDYWVEHVHHLSTLNVETTSVSQALKIWLGIGGPQQPSSHQYQAWVAHLKPGGPPPFNRRWDMGPRLTPSDNFIFGICSLGLHRLLKDWWDEDLDVLQENDYGQDLLALAAYNGHEDLCGILMERGSDVNRDVAKADQTSLGTAIMGGRGTTVELLLANNANPNRILQYHSLICLAAQGYDSAVLKLLLEHGADPNAQCQLCFYGRALTSAVVRRKASAVTWLIEAGASVNVDLDDSWGSPLAAAAYSGAVDSSMGDTGAP